MDGSIQGPSNNEFAKTIVGGRAFVKTKYYKGKIRTKNGDYINFLGGENFWLTLTQMLNEEIIFSFFKVIKS